MIEAVSWLGHAGFAVDLPPLILIDPFQVRGAASRKAAVILATHTHYDHLSPDDIARTAGENTVFVGPRDSAGKFPRTPVMLSPGEKTKIQDVEIEAVPAYNIQKSFHPKSNLWLGYLIRARGNCIYHAGDTDLIPEMSSIRCDIALLPVSGTYVMTAEEAGRAAKAIGAKFVIPMHYGSVVGAAGDAERFEKACPEGIEAVIKKPASLP